MNETDVIVVGGGPVGLTFAHAFSHAGIRFKVLEARNTVCGGAGSSLALHPGTVRVYQQLGILKEVEEFATAIQRNHYVTYDGKLYTRGKLAEIFQSLHGSRPLAFHRQELLRLLYDTIPAHDREHVHTSKKVVNIETGPDGATVHCTDGSVYQGSIVIGADGVHSKTRGFMRDLALKASLDAKVNPERPFKSTYRCMWGDVPTPASFGIGDYHECHGATCSSMMIVSSSRTWFFLYEYLDEAVSGERKEYTEDDMEEFAERLGDMHIAESLKFRDIWPTRRSAGMGNLEEGILDHWSWDRIVLAGDAAHKITPNIGLGYNAGVQDVVALTNLLYEFKSGKKESQPTSEVLGRIFKRYHEMRKGVMESTYQLSAFATRQSAWPNSNAQMFYRFIEWVSSVIPGFDWFMARFVASRVHRVGLVLDFLCAEEPCEGTIPWTYPMKSG